MLRMTHNLINVKMLVGEIDNKLTNDATSIGLLAYSGIQHTLLMPEMCRLFQTIFNLVECGFFWSDVEGNLTDAWCTSPHFLNFNTLMSCAQYQASGERTWPTFTENVRLGPVSGYLLPFQNERFYASKHYHQVYAPLAVKHLLDVVIHDGTRPYGAFLMMRTKSQGPFTPSERHFIEQLIPTLVAAFQTPLTPSAQFAETTTQGFAVISSEGKTRFMDTEASNIVWSLAYEQPGAFSNPEAPDLISYLDQIVEDHWERIGQGTRFTKLIQNRWGRYTLTFERQCHHDDFVLRFNKHLPMHSYLINKIHKLNLPPMRQMVAWLLGLNHSRPEIAEALGVSVETATTHIKTLYKETQTQSSHGLLLKLLS